MLRLFSASFPAASVKFWSSRFPGLLVALILSVAAFQLGSFFPVVGSAVFAIVLGVLFRGAVGLQAHLQSGITFSSKKLLQLGIILLGAGFNLQTIVATGVQSFPVMIGTLAIALLGGHAIGRWMGLPGRLVSLISAGTGICGASAISALSPIVEAEDDELAYSIATIFIFNLAAVFLFPAIGHLFHFSDRTFGVWAGTAVNDTSSVVAAGYSYSRNAGDIATVVKLTRSLMIIPVCLAFAGAKLLRNRGRRRGKGSVKFPLFIVGFVAMSAAGTLGWFGQGGGEMLARAGQACIVVALAAVGMSADLKGMARTGVRPLLLGLAVWGLVACSSLILQALTGLY